MLNTESESMIMVMRRWGDVGQRAHRCSSMK